MPKFSLDDIPGGTPRQLFGMIQHAIGHDKAIPREKIIAEFKHWHKQNITERGIRLAAEVIRNCGIRLIDLEDGAGLFIANTEDEYQHFRARYGSHAFSALRTIHAMDKGVNATEITDDEIIATKPIAVQLQLE